MDPSSSNGNFLADGARVGTHIDVVRADFVGGAVAVPKIGGQFWRSAA